jgi:hypothetical protein
LHVAVTTIAAASPRRCYLYPAFASAAPADTSQLSGSAPNQRYKTKPCFNIVPPPHCQDCLNANPHQYSHHRPAVLYHACITECHTILQCQKKTNTREHSYMQHHSFSSFLFIIQGLNYPGNDMPGSPHVLPSPDPVSERASEYVVEWASQWVDG